MKTIKEMQKRILWIYTSNSQPAAKVLIVKELYEWEKDIRENQKKKDDESWNAML